MSGNKDRSSNFCKEETNKLMLLLKDYPVITCKKTDHSSNKQKDAAWKLLTEKFNSDATRYRSVKQLQQKYNNMKKTARKEMAAEKYGRRQTGGGPAPPKPSETTEWLNSVMKETISGLAAVYDSDALDDTCLTIDIDTVPDENSSANVNLEFLVDNIDNECVPQNSVQPFTFKETEPNEVSKENISNNVPDTEVFDTSTPKAMLRKPVAKELVFRNKKKSYTPLETRKQLIHQSTKKIEVLAQKQALHDEIKKYAKEEHEQNLLFKKEAHEKAMQHMEELHQLELKNKKEMYKLILEKCKLETQKAEIELNKLNQ